MAGKTTASRSKSGTGTPPQAKTRAKRARKPAPAPERPGPTDFCHPSDPATAAVNAAAFCELPVGAAVFNADNVLISANHKFMELFEADADFTKPGRPLDQLIEHSFEEEIFRDISQVKSLVADIERLKPGDVMQNTLELRNGRSLGQHITKLENGYWLAVQHDMTAIVAAEEQVREAENRWNFALEGARQGVWDSNLKTGEVFYSHMWKVIRGLEDASAPEYTAEAWRARVHPDDAKRAIDTIRR